MKLGTRGSALALAQAQHVAALIGDGVEIVTITTTGDRDRAAPDKQKWVDAIESALLSGEIDIAVHSAKDVPADLAPGLELVAAGEREDPTDALVGAASLDDLPPGARVGTSSIRRRAQLRAAREDLEIVELRGNVDTRLRKLADGECDALVLAAAGLRRLGRDDAIGCSLDPAVFVPAPGQGTLAVEGRAGTTVPGLGGSPALEIERGVVAGLGATCDTPVGVLAGTDGVVRAWVGREDGSEWIRDEVRSDDPVPLLLERLRSMGAERLLRG